MTRMLSRVRFVLLGLVALAVLAGGILWWQRIPLLRWHYLNGLANANSQEREVWVDRVVSLDTEAVPGLLEHLSNADPQVCSNAQMALSRLVEKWGWEDPRTFSLIEDIQAQFVAFSLDGQKAILDWELAKARDASLPRAIQGKSAQLLALAGERTHSDLRKKVLVWVGLFLKRSPSRLCEKTCRSIILKELTAAEPEMRLEAIHLTLQNSFQNDVSLLKQVVPLLKDREALVRRAAILAIGSERKVITEEDLLFLLHDKDEDVRRLCKGALRSRGLHDSHILLGKLITDKRPQKRLEILGHLRLVTDLEPELWLTRLSHDPSPAVRVAAVREATTYPTIDMSSRLQEMAESDPSPTVKQLAQYYLQAR